MTQTEHPTPAIQRRRKTLVFHIGDHKTGSTSIQLAFAQRQVSLKNHSLFYPAQLASNPLAKRFKAGAARSESPARNKAITAIERLAKKVREADADFCLISGEGFEKTDPVTFYDIVTTYFGDTADEIRVIAYVRPHAARIISSFAERTKVGGQKVLDGGLEVVLDQAFREKTFPYQARFSAWREQFGDAFLLRPMIRSQLYKGSVVEDFIHHAFELTEFQVAGGTTANESLSLEDLMRLKVLQSHCRDHPKEIRLTLGWEFSRLVGALPPLESKTKIRLHNTLARDIHTACLADAQAVDRLFFDGTPLLETELNTAVETTLDTPQSVDPADYLSASDIRSLSILSKLVTEMLKNENGNWPNFFHGKRLMEVHDNIVTQ